jgi:hypothetical protein
MPFKHNASRRHRIPKMKYKVTNWPGYEAGLSRRGSLTLWLTPEALAAWRAPRRKTRGGQSRYSDLAIETVLTLGCVFGLRLRQSEGLMISLLELIGLDLPVPDHTIAEPPGAEMGALDQPAAKSRDWPTACAGRRQHRIESLRRRPMAGRQTLRKITPPMPQAASGSGC